KAMEDYYYSNFITTAVGASLDRLGEDLGLTRAFQFAQGALTLKVDGMRQGTSLTLPRGTILITKPPTSQAVQTLAPVTLTATAPQAAVTVSSFIRGPQGNLAANQSFGLDAARQTVPIDLGGATLTGVNLVAFSRGLDPETDDDYRAQLLGVPR